MSSPNGALVRDFTFASFDDLRLHVRLYEAQDASSGRPVVCLPGLTRNGKDFHRLAAYLAAHPERPRCVYCLDYRGRGLSQYDPEWRNYTPSVELRDVLDFMALASLHGAAVIGTSRGGIITMLMAALRPSALGVVVLNDIGPAIETRGLARIMGYAGRMPLPSSWADAASLVREMNERAYPAVDAALWEEVARSLFNEHDGRPAEGYDPNIGKTLHDTDLTRPFPDLWPQFAAMSQFPALVLRGANSDILSAETMDEMTRRHPNLRAVTIPGQGHAPLLYDAPTQETIGRFLTAND